MSVSSFDATRFPLSVPLLAVGRRIFSACANPRSGQPWQTMILRRDGEPPPYTVGMEVEM
jgi:hypothetical protein